MFYLIPKLRDGKLEQTILNLYNIGVLGVKFK